MISPARPRQILLELAAAAMALVIGSGCSQQGPETIYGSAEGTSLNGTRTFADLLRHQGHTVRSAWSLTEPLAGWANVLVRFSTKPGPIDRDEADWYSEWLDGEPGRSLIYVVRDYDAEPEYWDRVVQATDVPIRRRTPRRCPVAAGPGEELGGAAARQDEGTGRRRGLVCPRPAARAPRDLQDPGRPLGRSASIRGRPHCPCTNRSRPMIESEFCSPATARCWPWTGRPTEEAVSWSSPAGPSCSIFPWSIPPGARWPSRLPPGWETGPGTWRSSMARRFSGIPTRTGH